MPQFRYQAVTRSGEPVEGLHEADSRAEVLTWLQRQNYIVIDAALQAVAAPPRRTGGARTLGPRQRADLARELGTLLEAGLALDRALALLVRVATGKAQAALVGRLLDRVREGQSLSAALAAEPRDIPQGFLAAVRAGEAGGTLPDALARTAAALDRARRLQERIRSAMIYPAILAAAALATVALLVLLVIPTFAPMFADAGRELPAATRLLLAAADVARQGALPAAAVAALVWLLFRRLPTEAPLRVALDRRLLWLPLAGPLIRQFETARFAGTLAMLLEAGVGILPALETAAAGLRNRALRASLAGAIIRVREGAGLGDELAAIPAWPAQAAEMIRVGEETARLPTMLRRVAESYEEEAGRTIDRLVALLPSLVTLVLGAVVALVVVALLSAILAVNELAL